MMEQTGAGQEQREDTIQKLSGVKKMMFQHISKAKEYVQGTTFMEVDMLRIKEFRKRCKASYTSYIVHSITKALSNAPLINAQFDGENIIQKKHINIGVAVDSNGKLVVPVILDADRLSIIEIEAKIREFREKIEARKLGPEALQGATFTITNSGVFGSAFFTPIISYPQSAILGIAGIVDKPVVQDGEIVIRPICTLCLSYDHRIIEGSVAVKFLAEVRDILKSLDM